MNRMPHLYEVRKCRAHTQEPAKDHPEHHVWLGNDVADRAAAAADKALPGPR